MRRLATALAASLIAGSAHAHPGHLAPAAGHTHWELLAGLGVLAVAAVGAWAAWRRR